MHSIQMDVHLPPLETPETGTAQRLRYSPRGLYRPQEAGPTHRRPGRNLADLARHGNLLRPASPGGCSAAGSPSAWGCGRAPGGPPRAGCCGWGWPRRAICRANHGLRRRHVCRPSGSGVSSPCIFFRFSRARFQAAGVGPRLHIPAPDDCSMCEKKCIFEINFQSPSKNQRSCG